jgi:hypothetical protein
MHTSERMQIAGDKRENHRYKNQPRDEGMVECNNREYTTSEDERTSAETS